MSQYRKPVDEPTIDTDRQHQYSFADTRRQMNLHTILVHYLNHHFPDRGDRENTLLRKITADFGGMHNTDSLINILDTIAFCRGDEFEMGIRKKDGSFVDIKKILLNEQIPKDRLLGFGPADDAEEIKSFF